MSAAVAEQVVAIATITTDRGTAAAIAYEQSPVATVVSEQGPAGPPGKDAEGAAATDDGFF